MVYISEPWFILCMALYLLFIDPRHRLIHLVRKRFFRRRETVSWHGGTYYLDRRKRYVRIQPRPLRRLLGYRVDEVYIFIVGRADPILIEEAPEGVDSKALEQYIKYLTAIRLTYREKEKSETIKDILLGLVTGFLLGLVTAPFLSQPQQPQPPLIPLPVNGTAASLGTVIASIARLVLSGV